MYATQEQYTFLTGLSKDEQADVLPHLLRREIPKGEMIFHQGEPGDLLMFIAHGRVKISTVSDEGRELSPVKPSLNFYLLWGQSRHYPRRFVH